MNEKYEFNPMIENKKKALDAYKKMFELTEYFKGETNHHIKQNAIVVIDGLEKIIMLKEREIKNEWIYWFECGEIQKIYWVK